MVKTSDTVSSRAGLSLFVRYLENILLYPHLEHFLVVSPFQCSQKDPGYAGVIDAAPEAMLSSHSVNRFFKGFSWYRIRLFGSLLQQLFLRRLKRSKSEIIEIGIGHDGRGARQRIRL